MSNMPKNYIKGLLGLKTMTDAECDALIRRLDLGPDGLGYVAPCCKEAASCIRELLAELAAVKAERNALAKDAARYRFMRQRWPLPADEFDANVDSNAATAGEKP
jgi:hypothetical protein